jgi:hypothetical protein
LKVQLESTDQIVELETASGAVPARIWEGHTESGIAIHAFITRVGVHKEDDASQFERELLPCRAPSPVIAGVYPRRLVL